MKSTGEPAPPPAQTSGYGRGAALALVGFAALVAVAVRLPLLHLPLDPDEGGYAYLAAKWAGGAQLYSPAAWVDRPQGLLLVFRLVTDLSYTATALRIGAVAAAVVLTLGTASAAWALAGRRAAAVAGLLVAVVSAGPYVEGYEFNGELIAAAVGTAGVAGALWWQRRAAATGWLVPVGALCGSAPLMKQSAVDALVVLAAVALTSAGRRGRAVLAAVGGAAIPLAAAVVHGAVTGWSRWYFAVIGFQSAVASTSGGPGSRLDADYQTLLHTAPDLLGLLLLGLLGCVTVLRGSVRSLPPLLWLAAALVAVLGGPFAHPHYWVQAIAPLAVLAAVAATRLPGRALTCATLVAATLAGPLAVQLSLASKTPQQRVAALTDDQRLLVNGQMSTWLRAHTAPTDTVFAFTASADLYLLADRSTGYPYLWNSAFQAIPSAEPRLADWLDGASGPRWVVLYNPPDSLDPSGRLQTIISSHYGTAAVVDGVTVLRRA
ncbi:hypothetical protein P3T37_001962 [Kitasatospora sp. MAA4]|uniref:hypothetical protein n=1 Tax=Kitasatospora sp. MAA4 TaxID=3035093 RepID=UPI00247390AC|nr:hypothetical protein [Kitasatospora sp. MAA4]MDH6132577.1 hypothetical protein [Kitasatospora sp. MAA4]